MNNYKLKSNELKILIYLLKRLEKRIYLLKVSLYGDDKSYFTDISLPPKKKLQIQDNEWETTYNFSIDDYRLATDSSEIETYIHRILYEMMNMKTYNSLKEVIGELESENTAFKEHEEIIEAKRRQTEHLKEVISLLQEQKEVQVMAHRSKRSTLHGKEATGKKIDLLDETHFLKRLMDCKAQSRKDYYEHKFTELQKNIERIGRETRSQEHANIQIISFWLLKYDNYTERLDMLLKQMFDNWTAKRREMEILKKYRKLNLERIQKLRKLISEREDYIEKDNIKKEREQMEREEQLRKKTAATIVQAYWRGTMVRKHLGPYKVKKKKQGKSGKGKKKR